MREGTAPTIRRLDYAPPPYRIRSAALTFDLDPAKTLVASRLEIERAPGSAEQPLVLDGEGLTLLRVLADGDSVSFHEEPGRLVIEPPPGAERFVLEIRNTVAPDKNTELSGLYTSSGGFYTQCEAEGFRRITYFIDRPDVMAAYTVTLRADRTQYPVLLANGNLVDQGTLDGGRHYATWHDPHPKPSYLFALVAADLVWREQRIRTRAGREHLLQIYVKRGDLGRTEHAMGSLIAALVWDEARFGLALDLERYMVVAVDDFNFGAMENKGLNLFNTRCVLASPASATDADFLAVESVVAHEYFHNWTGNRITCRDWFQLSLKEGLTVFRDQEFGADLHNRQTARIREVRGLRAAQFPEDAGPMAHPVRPSSFVEINNFYTATVYEKGAEVIRMIQTLIGRDGFRAGMDEYFRRHDGQAVTCEDFVAAMAANVPQSAGIDFAQFMRWYNQPGTPHVAVDGYFDAESKTYTLTCTQSNSRASDEFGETGPYLIPIRVALFTEQGELIAGSERTLQLTATTQSFVFNDVAAEPVPSLLRNFSAPVYLDFDYTPEQLTLLMAHESDAFNAWEAGQRLATTLILDAATEIAAGRQAQWPESFVTACRRLLQTQAQRGAAFVAETLTLPGESTLAEMLDLVDPDALHAARNALRRHLAEELEGEFSGLYTALASNAPYAPTSEQAGRRALRNVCLAYLLELDTPTTRQLALNQFAEADNMTDQFAALAALANVNAVDCPERDSALADFYARWQNEALVVDKWLAVQSTSRRPDTLATVKALTGHPAFDAGNPNKIYALIRSFGANHVRFNAADGSGYAFIADRVLDLHDRNPQVASRLARCFDRWKKFDTGRQMHARAALERIRDHDGLSRDVLEIVSRALGSA